MLLKLLNISYHEYFLIWSIRSSGTVLLFPFIENKLLEILIFKLKIRILANTWCCNLCEKCQMHWILLSQLLNTVSITNFLIASAWRINYIIMQVTADRSYGFGTQQITHNIIQIEFIPTRILCSTSRARHWSVNSCYNSEEADELFH